MQKIADVCDVNAKSISTKDKKEQGYFHYLDLTNITDNQIDTIKKIDSNKLPSRAKRIVRKNDIIISTVRPVQKHHGILTNPPENLLVSTGYTVLTVDEEKANPHYLYHYISNHVSQKRMELIARTSTSSYPSLRPEDISDLSYTKESLDYQIKVGETLSFFEEKIEINRKELFVLEDYSELLFHKWFIDFNFPNMNEEPYKDNKGEMVVVDGKLIPKGWSIQPLEKFIKDASNGDWGKETSYDGAIETYCIRGADMPNIKHGIVGDTPLRYIKSSKDKKKSLTNGNIVIEASGGSSTQSTGRTVLIRDSLLEKLEKPLYFSNFSKVIIPKSDHSMFVYHLLNKLYHRDVFFYYEGKTSGIKNLLINNMTKRIKFVSPPLELLKRFEEESGVLWDKIFSLGHEIELLQEAKDLLIHKLIK